MAQECTKRPHVCQHCGFKATYEEVVDTHLPECKYVALQCPNMCGVSCEREVMEDHMKICRLEEVECEFSSVGCDGRFIREDQDEHARQNSQKHLTLTTSLVVNIKNDFQRKMEKQEHKIQEQERVLKKQEKRLEQQEITLGEQMKTLEEKDMEITELKVSLQENQQRVFDLFNIIVPSRKFEMKNFSLEKAKDKPDDWLSPAMYTHVCGYKFCIGVDANGRFVYRNKKVAVSVWSMPGEFDDQLKWPVRLKLTLELINQQGGENAIYESSAIKLEKISHMLLLKYYSLIFHSKIQDFLANDTLYFYVSKVEILT